VRSLRPLAAGCIGWSRVTLSPPLSLAKGVLQGHAPKDTRAVRSDE